MTRQLAVEGLSWDVPAKKLSIRPNLPASCGGRLRAFLPGSVAWGRLEWSSVETDCDQRLTLSLRRPFELERLGVRNTGRPTVAATRAGTPVPCTLSVASDREYEIVFQPPLRLDEVPVEIRIGAANSRPAGPRP